MINKSYFYITDGNYIVRRNDDCSISDSVDFNGITIVIYDRRAPEPNADMLFDSRQFTNMVSRYEPYILSACSNISRLFSEIAKLFRSADTALLRIRAIESLMLISKDISEYANGSSEKAALVGDFICRNISTHYTISQLSELFELNTTSLKAVFRRIFGCSIYAYAKNRKMFCAVELLRDTGKMFSQSISGLNRFKLRCNNEFAEYGLDPIGKPTEMMMDTVVHEMSEGFDCLELFDEIMADKASSLSDLYNEPVTEYKPLYTPEYTRGESIVCAPTQTRTYFNPDSPKPWCRIIVNPDGSWGIPTRPFDDFDEQLIRFMSWEDQQRVRMFFPQHQCYHRRQEVSGKQFTENPYLFLNNRCEINITIESEAERDNVIAVLGRLRRMAEAEKAYNTKLGIASMAQINQLGIPANVTADNTTTLNVTIKGNDDSEQTIHEVIELPDKNKQ